MSQELDYTKLDLVFDRILSAEKRLPEVRAAFLERAGTELENVVRGNVSSRISDNRGKVAGWQERHIGSRYGYAAVRARRSTLAEQDEANRGSTPGAITNYLENGHKIRPPGGSAKRYRPKIKVARVSGRYFYRASRASLDALAASGAQELAKSIAKELIGK